MNKFLVYGNGQDVLQAKVLYRDKPLPEELNIETIKIAEQFEYPKLVEMIQAAKKYKRFGSAHYYLNGIEIAKFDFWFGICMRVVYALGDIGDSYKEIYDKLKASHGQVIQFAMFKKSYVPESICTKRPHDNRVNAKSPDYKKAYLEGKV